MPGVFKLLKVEGLILIIALFSYVFPLTRVNAATQCDVAVSTTEVAPSSTGDLTFTVTNIGGSAIVWVRVSAPGEFTINSGDASGWSASSTSAQVTFMGGNIATESAQGTFSVNVTAVDYDAAPVSFGVDTSDVADGSGALACSGSSAVSITTDSAPPIISAIGVSASSSSTTITWTTDENVNSRVDYGTNASYGSNKTDSGYSTSHSLSIEGLSASTTYHFKVTSTDAAGNTSETEDNTFVTAAAGSTTTVTTTVTTTTTKTVTDTTLPSVSVSTDLSEVFKEAPEITGKATDDVGVSLVEYSIDGGRNWLPAQMGLQPGRLPSDSIGAKSVTFTFTPSIIDDGNYDIKVRATDPSGNRTVSKTYTLIIDRLPPLVGGVLFSLGPMVLLPDAQGKIYTIEGLDTNITLSTVGGPITLEIFTKLQTLNSKLKSENGTFSLVKNIESGLWKGTVNFVKEGIFDLLTKAIDGAENVTEGELGRIISLKAGKVLNDGNSIKDAKISVYAFEPGLGEFLLWNAVPYGQENPQSVGGEGEYKLILPPGKYYLEVSAPGYSRVRTSIFEIDRPTPITQDFSLDKRIGFHLGKIFIGLPDFRSRVVDVQTDIPETGEKVSEKAGTTLPDFSFESEKQVISNISLLGKPTVLTFISTWAPETSDQLAALEEFADEFKEINVYAIAEQEGNGKVETFKKVGGYQVHIVADSDGVLIEPLSLRYFPSHVFIDRKGIVKKIVVGFLTKDEMADILLD